MPVGCLNDPIPDGILNLGFEIVDSIKCLGLVINNKASDLESNFDAITEKIRKLAVHWGRFNLSLMGKISIAKTMLVSQIGYIGCIITPRPDQMAAMQNIIDRFVTGSIVIAEDRLYSKPKNGGLGLIDLKNYITALQCSWIKRCRQQINDPWRWNLVASCNFRLEDLNLNNIDRSLFPVEYNIASSYEFFKKKFFCTNENFLHARLVNNEMFLRAAPERRVRENGHIGRNLLGGRFYDENKERLLCINMNDLVRNGAVVGYHTLLQNTGINFSQAVYMHLVRAGNFALTKYAGKEGSNGTSMTLGLFLDTIKKGSRRFRTIDKY